MKNKIITENTRPPIPTKKFDWSAYREDYEPGKPIGHGETEKEALEDLIEIESL